MSYWQEYGLNEPDFSLLQNSFSKKSLFYNVFLVLLLFTFFKKVVDGSILC